MELNFCEETIDPYDRDGRASLSGEGPSSGPGAGLEYDLWEGQFQFVGQQPSTPPPPPPLPPLLLRSNDRHSTRRRGPPRLSEQVRERNVFPVQCGKSYMTITRILNLKLRCELHRICYDCDFYCVFIPIQIIYRKLFSRVCAYSGI